MSNRFMRLLLFFDLPTETAQDRREYSRFRKFLLRSGFMMMQESVYCKLALNQTVINSLIESVRKHRPRDGLVQTLVITEKQYARMEFIIGECINDIVNTEERYIEL